MNKILMKSKFSRWLKKHREESGLTLVELQKAIDGLCTDAYLSKLENDRYKGKKGRPAQPDIEIVDALAVAFKRPADEARFAANYAPKDFDLSRFNDRGLLLLREFIGFLFSNPANLDTASISSAVAKQDPIEAFAESLKTDGKNKVTDNRQNKKSEEKSSTSMSKQLPKVTNDDELNEYLKQHGVVGWSVPKSQRGKLDQKFYNAIVNCIENADKNGLKEILSSIESD